MGLRPSMAQKSNMLLNPSKGLLLVQHLSIVSLWLLRLPVEPEENRSSLS